MFLCDFFNKYSFPGPQNHLEKGLIIIYELITGYNDDQIGNYIKKTTYKRIKEKLFITLQQELNAWIENCMLELFSSPELRLSNIYNNNGIFNFITLMLNIYDNNSNYKKNKYISDNPSFLTPFICDRRGIIIWVGDTVQGTKDNVQFNLTDLRFIVSSSDCIFLNTNIKYIKDILKYNKDNYNKNNFIYPNNENDRKKYKDLEIPFKKIYDIFKKLSYGKCPKNINKYSLYFKLSCLLYNFSLSKYLIDDNKDARLHTW